MNMQMLPKPVVLKVRIRSSQDSSVGTAAPKHLSVGS